MSRPQPNLDSEFHPDMLQPLERQMWDFHQSELDRLEKEATTKEVEAEMKRAQANALREMAALTGTGVKSMIQKDLDNGDLKQVWSKVLIDYEGNEAAALGRLLIENVNICMQRLKDQSVVEEKAMVQILGVLGYLRQQKERAQALRDGVYQQFLRRVRSDDVDPKTGRPLTLRELMEKQGRIKKGSKKKPSRSGATDGPQRPDVAAAPTNQDSLDPHEEVQSDASDA